MAFSGPPIGEEHPLPGVAHDSDDDRAGEGEGIPPLSSHDEDEFEEDGRQQMEREDEEGDENTDDDDDGTGGDSGYDSTFEDEEDFGDDDDNIRPCSPLIQRFPPEDLGQGRRQACPPCPAGVPAASPVAVPRHLLVRRPQVPGRHQEPCDQQLEELEDLLQEFCLTGNSASFEELSVPQRSEESAPSKSGLSSCTKRSRDENYEELVSAKRPRWYCEESPEESAPSTSGLISSTKRGREENYGEQVSAKRARWNCEESPEESAPSTSGLSFLTNRSREEDYRDSAPSTSGLSSFTNWRCSLSQICPEWSDDSDYD